MINISEGRDLAVLDRLRHSCVSALLDVHTDTHHNRSVFTLGGPHVEDAARSLTRAAVTAIDIRNHAGVHPRIGIVDVVPFVPLPSTASTMQDARRAQLAYAEWVAKELEIPAFLYGSNRSLPRVRSGAFHEFPPDFGPTDPHLTAGSIAVGARDVLVAYNLWLRDVSLEQTRAIAKAIRQPGLRTLGLQVGEMTQVSCNLISPLEWGPAQAYDLVIQHEPIDHAELVGLLPQVVLDRQPKSRWQQLDLGEDRTIETRLVSLTGLG